MTDASQRGEVVVVPRASVQRLILAADSYGVRYLDSDDMTDEAEELQGATEAIKDLLAAAPPAPSGDSGGELWSVGSWLSSALDDPRVCDEMKADICAWFGGGGHIRSTPHLTASYDLACRIGRLDHDQDEDGNAHDLDVTHDLLQRLIEQARDIMSMPSTRQALALRDAGGGSLRPSACVPSGDVDGGAGHD